MNGREKLLYFRNVFLRIVSKYKMLENRPQDYGTGVLFPVEIHTIDMIGNNPGINVTELAELMGVTKGAVSQQIKKLEKKGCIRRVKRPGNQKEVILELEEMGWTAYNGHQAFHARYDDDAIADFGSMTPEQVDFLIDFLARIEANADRYLSEVE